MVKKIRPSSVSTALKQMVDVQKKAGEDKHSTERYSIMLANTLEEREAVFRLAYKVYLEKGYVKESANEWLIKKYDAFSDTAILIVQDRESNIVGTITMIFDGVEDIPAEVIYKNEIVSLRAKKERIVEISRLAIKNEHRNAKEILILLFNCL